jgi:excisionase family DNA binding protein
MTQPDPNPKLARTVNDACAATGLSRSTFYRKVRAGELRTFRWGGKTLIYEADLRAALDRASGRSPPAG